MSDRERQIEALAPIIEEMESRYPEHVIAERCIDALRPWLRPSDERSTFEHRSEGKGTSYLRTDAACDLEVGGMPPAGVTPAPGPSEITDEPRRWTIFVCSRCGLLDPGDCSRDFDCGFSNGEEVEVVEAGGVQPTKER